MNGLQTGKVLHYVPMRMFQLRSITSLVLAAALGGAFVVPAFARAQTPALTNVGLERPDKNAQQLKDAAGKAQTQQNTVQKVKAQAEDAAATAARAAVGTALEKLRGAVASARAKVAAMQSILSADQSRLIALLDAETRWLSEQAAGLSSAPLSVIKQRAVAVNGHKGQTKAVIQRALGESQALRTQATAQRLQTQISRAQKLVDTLIKRNKASKELTDTAEAATTAAGSALAQSKQTAQFFQSLPSSGANDGAYAAGTSQLAATRAQIKQANAQLQTLTALLKTAIGSR